MPRVPDRSAGDAAGARDQFAALLPIVERVLGPEHRTPYRSRQPRRLDRPGGGCGRGPRPVPPCCPSSSEFWAPNTANLDHPP